MTAVIIGLVAAFVAPAGANGTSNGEYPLFAGQDIKVGTVHVTNNTTTIHVEFALDSPWCMTESHVEVVDDPHDFPTTNKGNPIPGKFESTMYHDCTTGTTHHVDAGDLGGGSIYIAAHAKVWDTSSVAEVTFSTADSNDMTGFGRFGAYVEAVSSTTTSPILEAAVHPAYDDSITAPWVTIADNSDPNVDQWFRIDHSFAVPGLPLGAGTVDVNSDNADEVLGNTSVTGTPGAVSGPPIRGAHTATSTYTFPAHMGDNTLSVVVRNYFPTSPSDNPDSNPMALTYAGSVEYYDITESAWAGTMEFPGKNWATSFQYDISHVWLCHFGSEHVAFDDPYGDDRNGTEPGFWTVGAGVEAGTFLDRDYIVRFDPAGTENDGLNSGQVGLCEGNGGTFKAVPWTDLPDHGDVQLIARNLTNGYPIGWTGPSA